MRAGILVAGMLLAGAAIPAQAASMCKPITVTCECQCPVKHTQRLVRHVVRPVHRIVRRSAPAQNYQGYYDYYAAGAVGGEFHGDWRQAPDDGYVAPRPVYYAPPPQAYYPPPPAYYAPPPPDGMRIDDRGFSGGVGYGDEAGGGGGGGGGFADGYGQVHFANGGGSQNGPTYNDYNQSFQTNPTGYPGAFVPQRMGAPAPVSTGTGH